jgi:hypothetical protein
MRRGLPSISMRADESSSPELPLRMPEQEALRPTPIPVRRPGDRIKDALLRWLEEEL